MVVFNAETILKIFYQAVMISPCSVWIELKDLGVQIDAKSWRQHIHMKQWYFH